MKSAGRPCNAGTGPTPANLGTLKIEPYSEHFAKAKCRNMSPVDVRRLGRQACVSRRAALRQRRGGIVSRVGPIGPGRLAMQQAGDSQRADEVAAAAAGSSEVLLASPFRAWPQDNTTPKMDDDFGAKELEMRLDEVQREAGEFKAAPCSHPCPLPRRPECLVRRGGPP